VADLPAPPDLGRLELTSLNGDGRLAAVRYAPPLAGWYEREPPPPDGGTGAGWSPLRLFDSAASVDWTSPDLRLADLDGDGLADVLISGDEVFT
jgi:hypothetical protein